VTGVLYFDGVCGMCTRVRNLLVRLDRTGDLDTRPFQQEGTAQLLGVPASKMVESSWWLDSSGAVYAGAEAINAALSAALGTRLPLRIYRLPGIRRLQEAVYRWVATHRYRFRGTTPYCESHPVAC
jgi:predicted DCC family thiol-disulfide oxidoreductase YuxK